jgi:CRISPR-associated endoribonuclease Cas6
LRAKIHLTNVNQKTLPFDYQYWLASVLYRKLDSADKELAKVLHLKNGSKFHTFSWIFPDDDFSVRKQGLWFSSGSFVLSSPDPEYIRGFSEGLLDGCEFFLGPVRFVVDSIEILQQPVFSDQAVFRTLSPLYLKTLSKNQEGTLQERDLYPKDGKFYENIHVNLVKKYGEYYQKLVGNHFFEIRQISRFKAKKVKVKDSYRRCSLVDNMVVEAPSYLLEFAYDAGLGEKTAMGFGCLGCVTRGS